MAQTTLSYPQYDGAVNVKNFGAVGDGVTDDTAAFTAALTAAGRNGSVYVPVGTYLTSSTIALSEEGQKLYGECWRGSIIYYTGTGTAINTKKVAQEVCYLHITSLDPTTVGHIVSDNSGSGTGDVGILLEHVDGHIHHNTISYFNSASLNAAAIKTNGTVGFSNNIHDNYIRYCWGGITLEDTITDTSIRDNTILDIEKYGISVGYDWDAAAQTTFTGDNFRIDNNLIQNVCKNKSAGGGVGDGFAIRINTAVTSHLTGNYVEDYDAQSGFVAYGIYCDGITGGDKLLGTRIDNNNVVTSFGGTSYSVWIDNAWYGGGHGNHFGAGGGGQVHLTANARYFHFGINYFTGAPAAPYTLNGTSNSAYDPVLSKVTSSSGYTLQYDHAIRMSARSINTEATLTVNSVAPDVSTGNQFVTANTSPTTYNNFSGTDGQTIMVIFGDANSTVDFTGTSLKGNAGVDWTPSSDDHMVCTRSGGNWYCVISDNTV